MGRGVAAARRAGPFKGRRGGRYGRGGRLRTGRKTQEQLDYEMDILEAERDGGDVEAVKAAYRAKKEEKKKNILDSQMDSYFEEKAEEEKKGNPEVANGADGKEAEKGAVVNGASGSKSATGAPEDPASATTANTSV